MIEVPVRNSCIDIPSDESGLNETCLNRNPPTRSRNDNSDIDNTDIFETKDHKLRFVDQDNDIVLGTNELHSNESRSEIIDLPDFLFLYVLNKIKGEIVNKFEEYVECISNAKKRGIYELVEDKNIDITTFHQKALSVIQADKEDMADIIATQFQETFKDRLARFASEPTFEDKENVENLRLRSGGERNLDDSDDSSSDSMASLPCLNPFSRKRKDSESTSLPENDVNITYVTTPEVSI